MQSYTGSVLHIASTLHTVAIVSYLMLGRDDLTQVKFYIQFLSSSLSYPPNIPT